MIFTESVFFRTKIDEMTNIRRFRQLPLNNRFNKIKENLSISHHSRTVRTKSNIFLLYIFHSFNFVFNLLIVPLSISILGEVKYGIWLTISSLLLWLSYLDLGIGNGLRNKLSESLARQDISRAKNYISTAYAIFGMGAAGLIIIFIFVNNLFNWNEILKVPSGNDEHISLIILFVFIFFVLQLFLRLITSVLNADQKPALNGMITFIVNIITLSSLYIIYHIGNSNLLPYSFIYSFIPVVVLSIISILLFSRLYKSIAPSLQAVDFHKSGELFGLGFQFFIMQIAGLITFAASNLIITTFLGPAEVTVYNVAYRYFFFVSLFFNVIITPLWSAYTEAYVKGDIEWIRKTIKKIIKVWMILSLGVIVMIFISGFAYKIWVGDKIEIPFMLSVFMGVFTIISNWNNIFAFFLNGVGKIRLQFYLAIFIVAVNIPLAIVLVKYFNTGSSGVIISSSICLFAGSMLAPIQYRKLINNTASGIWDK